MSEVQYAIDRGVQLNTALVNRRLLIYPLHAAIASFQTNSMCQQILAIIDWYSWKNSKMIVLLFGCCYRWKSIRNLKIINKCRCRYGSSQLFGANTIVMENIILSRDFTDSISDKIIHIIFGDMEKIDLNRSKWAVCILCKFWFLEVVLGGRWVY